MAYLKPPGRHSRDFMHEEPEPEPGQRQQNKPFEVSMNFTHHLRDVNAQICALTKTNQTSPLIITPMGYVSCHGLPTDRQLLLLRVRCSAETELRWRHTHTHTHTHTAAHIVMQSMLFLPHLLFHFHFWRINHLSRDICC